MRAGLRALRASGWWKPSAASYLLRSGVFRATREPSSDDDALRAAAAWLARAHDATRDGGIAGRYRLAGAWSSSYPETTGYAIPTLLQLAEVLDDPAFKDRAQRCVEFLLSVQLPSGGFPGLEIADNRTEPSPFNSAQIIHGLQRWHRATGDRRAADAMLRGAHWICDVQDDDGAWRRHAYRQVACTYSAHAACWLADLAEYTGEPRFRAAAERNLAWVLAHRDAETGWIDGCGFSAEDHRLRRAHTHTIAYTLAGVLRMSERLEVAEGTAAVRCAAERLMERLERSGTLAGVLDYRWRPQSTFVCLTGNAQMAVLWLRIAEAAGDLRFVNAAFKAIDEVKRAQSLTGANPGIRGGIAGSSPIQGDYISFAFPNWAAKFFVDALCAKRSCLDSWLRSVSQPRAVLSDDDVEHEGREVPRNGTVAVYTTRISPKFAALANRWQTRGFRPVLVVVEDGTASAARSAAGAFRHPANDCASICRRHGWRYVRSSSANDPSAIREIRNANPLVAVNAGAGLLRADVLAVPRAGTLSAHMGRLPAYRGMNVAEWAALAGDPAGCSVLWLDRGVDTGPVIANRHVGISDCRSIAVLRSRIDEHQLALLDETLRTIVDEGRIPPAREQRAEDGRQFFRMHADLRQELERRLAGAR